MFTKTIACSVMPSTLKPMVTSSKSDTCLQERKDKKVRFADSMGLALVSICFIPEARIQSAVRKKTNLPEKDEKVRLLNFTRPVSRLDFSERIDIQNVCLEDIVFRDYSVMGTIKVRNLAYEKRVLVRFTANGWVSFQDVEARYVDDSTTDLTDRFSFEIAIPGTLQRDFKVEFAICYEVLGMTFWDNNNGDNYRVICYGQPARWKSSNLFETVDIYQSRYVGLSL